MVFGRLRSLSVLSDCFGEWLNSTTFSNTFVAKQPALTELEIDICDRDRLELTTPSTTLKALSIRSINEASLNPCSAAMFDYLVILRLHIEERDVDTLWMPFVMQSPRLKCLEIFQCSQAQPDGSVSEMVGNSFLANVPNTIVEYHIRTTFSAGVTFEAPLSLYEAAILSTKRLVSQYFPHHIIT